MSPRVTQISNPCFKKGKLLTFSKTFVNLLSPIPETVQNGYTRAVTPIPHAGYRIFKKYINWKSNQIDGGSHEIKIWTKNSLVRWINQTYHFLKYPVTEYMPTSLGQQLKFEPYVWRFFNFFSDLHTLVLFYKYFCTTWKNQQIL